MANVPSQEMTEDNFPPCDTRPNLEYEMAAVSLNPVIFIQEAATREGELLFRLLRHAANPPCLTRLPQQLSGNPITKVQQDSLPDIGPRCRQMSIMRNFNPPKWPSENRTWPSSLPQLSSKLKRIKATGLNLYRVKFFDYVDQSVVRTGDNHLIRPVHRIDFFRRNLQLLELWQKSSAVQVVEINSRLLIVPQSVRVPDNNTTGASNPHV
jgi:hypothetical protein